MAYVCRQADFTVTVESDFADNGRFVIRGRVAYAPSIDRAAREDARTGALLAMIAGITRESGIGRTLGVRSVGLHIDGDVDLSELFRKLARESRPRRVAKDARIGIPAQN